VIAVSRIEDGELRFETAITPPRFETAITPPAELLVRK
jgi:hypothetical protein